MSSILAFPFDVEMSRVRLAFERLRKGAGFTVFRCWRVCMYGIMESAVNITNPAWDDDDKS